MIGEVEADRVVKFGFTVTELDRQKTAMARRLERAVIEKDNQESADLAAEYGRNFLEGEPMPGIVYENELYKRFLPEITLDELNALARTWSPDRSRVVMVSAPEKPGVTLPTDAQLQAVIAGAAGKATTAYADTATASPLVATPPTPGTIAKTTTHEASGITEWTLSNGVTVVLKPTTFKQDEVVFRAFRYGGSSLASDADFIPAQVTNVYTLLSRGESGAARTELSRLRASGNGAYRGVARAARCARFPPEEARNCIDSEP